MPFSTITVKPRLIMLKKQQQ